MVTDYFLRSGGRQTVKWPAERRGQLPRKKRHFVHRRRGPQLTSHPESETILTNPNGLNDLKLTPLRSLYDEIVHVKVGANKIDYGVHKGLLCHYSSYFAAALNGNFKEAKENTVELLEDSPKTFEQFNLWLYSQCLFEKGEDETTLDWYEMTKLYVWADKRGIPKLQDAAVDAIIRKHKFENLIPTYCIRIAYDNLPASDPLRRLLIDLCVQCGDIEKLFIDIGRKRFTKGALFDIALGLFKLRQQTLSHLEGSRCNYHHHPGHQQCV